MVNAEADEVIQAFSTKRGDIRLAIGVRSGRLDGRFHCRAVLRLPKFLHGVRVFPVAVANQEPSLQIFVLQPHGYISALLHDPVRVWMNRGIRVPNLACPNVDVDKHVDCIYAVPADDFFREEIAGHQCIHVCPDKVLPCDGRFLGACDQRGPQIIFNHDITNGGLTDENAQFLELAADTSVTPTTVLARDAMNEVADSLSDTATPGAFEYHTLH